MPKRNDRPDHLGFNAEWIGTEFGLQAAATNESAAVPTGTAAVLFILLLIADYA